MYVCVYVYVYVYVNVYVYVYVYDNYMYMIICTNYQHVLTSNMAQRISHIFAHTEVFLEALNQCFSHSKFRVWVDFGYPILIKRTHGLIS